MFRNLRSVATVARAAAFATARVSATRTTRPVLSAAHSCRYIHQTSAKLDLFESLQREIDDEASSGVPPVFESTFGDFKIEANTGSPLVIFTKATDGQKVTVTLNLNECEIDAEQPTPYFNVTIQKDGSDKSLVAECTIADSDLTIEKVAYTTVTESDDLHDGAYFADMSLLDQTLYDDFLNHFADAGIDEDFIAFLEGYTADKEYHEYLNWLQTLHDTL